MRHDMHHDMQAGDTMVTADDLAHSIAEDGMGVHEQTLLWMAKMAARHGVSPTLLAAMLDQTAPEVTRQRAFGEVMRGMQRRPAGAEALALSVGVGMQRGAA